jgi:hypothetical protein
LTGRPMWARGHDWMPRRFAAAAAPTRFLPPAAAMRPRIPCRHQARGPSHHFHAETTRCSHYRSTIKPMGCGIVQIAGVLAAHCRTPARASERSMPPHRASVDNNAAMTAAQARQLATPLVDAADELERLRSAEPNRISRRLTHYSARHPPSWWRADSDSVFLQRHR